MAKNTETIVQTSAIVSIRSSHSLLRTLSLFSGKTKQWFGVGILMMTQSFLIMGITVIISKGIDLLTGEPTVNRIILLVGSILFLGLVQWVCGYFQKKLTQRSVIDTLRELQNRLFRSMIRKNISYFSNNSSGIIISRITGDTEAFGQFIHVFVSQSGVIMSIVVLLAALFFIDFLLACLLVAFIPIIIGAALLFKRLSQKVSRRMYEMFAELNANIKESLAGVTIAKNFVREEAMYQRFQPINEQAYKANMAQGRVFSSILPLTNLLSSLGMCVILYLGGREVLDAGVSFGILYLFVQTVQRIWDPISSFANFSNQIQDGMAAAERIFAILEEEEEETNLSDESGAEWRGGDIRFRQVSFSYDSHVRQLENFSLTIKEGERVAVVGHTGAGKTTLARILLRFHDYRDGSVTVGGVELRSIGLKSLRSQIGYIPQVPFLFAGTLRDNLTYGNAKASDASIWNSVRMINGGAWLEDFPRGLDTQIGERGGNLSAGQRQLIALVRVMVKNPSLLVMDEATANIDPFTESHIRLALKIVMKNRTSVIIAHRLSTIRDADKIIVLSSGQIAEVGTHEQLMTKGGAYKQL